VRRPSRMMILGLLAAALAGCATYSKEVSYLYGERYNRTNIHTFATIITAIDGESTAQRAVPVPIEPGQHVISLATAPVAGFRIPQTRDISLNVEPCKRYFIVAERDNRLQQNWRPLVDYVDDAGGNYCR
jgi:hypothetical protein